MSGRKLGWLYLFVVVFLALTTTGWARQCSLETVKGTYTFLEQGATVIPLPPGPFVLTAVATFDGKGNFLGTFSENEGGLPPLTSFVSGTFTGTYAVTSDCAYSDDFFATHDSTTHHLHHTGQISGEGILQEIRYIYKEPPLVVSGTGKKQ